MLTQKWVVRHGDSASHYPILLEIRLVRRAFAADAEHLVHGADEVFG